MFFSKKSINFFGTRSSSAVSIAVYTDHAPPHFHIRGANTRVSIDLRTLQVIQGRYERKELALAMAWAAQPENLALIEAEWRRLNERD